MSSRITVVHGNATIDWNKINVFTELPILFIIRKANAVLWIFTREVHLYLGPWKTAFARAHCYSPSGGRRVP